MNPPPKPFHNSVLGPVQSIRHTKVRTSQGVAFVYLHDVEEVVVDLRPVVELVLDLVQVGQGVLNLQPRVFTG